MDDHKVKPRLAHLLARIQKPRTQEPTTFYVLLFYTRRSPPHFLLVSSTTSSIPDDHSDVGYVIFVLKVVVDVKLLSYYFSRLSFGL